MTEEERLRQQQVTPVTKPQQQGQYTNMQGISDASRNNLNYYAQGYQPSQNVAAAQSYLQGVIDKKPGEYQSQYGGQIQNLYNQIMNRPKFRYDVNQDPLFQQYKNQYMANGQRAMQDTVGNAAALTGGYGNSWGTTAGYQAYQEYLRQLGAIVPELEGRAYDRYNDEGDQLRDNMNLTLNLDNIGYGRYRDMMGDWQADRDYADTAYQRERGNDQDQWNSMLNFYLQQAAKENADYWNDRDLAWQREQMENENRWKQLDYDFELRKYEDALAKAAGGGGYGGGSGNAGEAAAEDAGRKNQGVVPYSQEYLNKVYQALGGAVPKAAINRMEPTQNAALLNAAGVTGQTPIQRYGAGDLSTGDGLKLDANVNMGTDINRMISGARKEIPGGFYADDPKKWQALYNLLK